MLPLASPPFRFPVQGHLSRDRLSTLVRSGVLGSVPVSELSPCMACKLGKLLALPYPSSTTSVSASLFDLVHSYVWGPA